MKLFHLFWMNTKLHFEGKIKMTMKKEKNGNDNEQPYKRNLI
jgi:hypothetical protein